MDYLFLTPEELAECKRVAKERFEEQERDYRNGDGRAGYSNGKKQKWNARDIKTRKKHALMGAIGEQQTAKFMKCPWLQEHGQYKGNKRPDLTCIYRGKETRVEARMTERKDVFIVRETDLDIQTDLLSCSNVFIGWIGWIEFSKLSTLIREGKSERVNAPGKPAWWISNEYLSTNTTDFG